MGDKAVAWPVCRCWVPDTTATWLGVPFLQFIAHTNPSSRQLQGTLACAMICRKATFTISFSEVMLPDANFLSSRAQNRVFCALFGSGTPVFGLFEHKMVLRQISCCQVKQVWKILIQRSRSEARPYILLLIYFILLFRPSISPLLIEYFMAFLMGEISCWTLFTKLTTSP